MAYPSSGRVIAVLVGTSTTALTAALSIVVLQQKRREPPYADTSLLVYASYALQILFGVTSCILAVVSQYPPGVDSLLTWLGLLGILSAQFTEWLHMQVIFGMHPKVRFALSVTPVLSLLCFILGRLPPIPDSPAWNVVGCAIHRLSIGSVWFLFCLTTTATPNHHNQYRYWLVWHGLGLLATSLGLLPYFETDLDTLLFLLFLSAIMTLPFVVIPVWKLAISVFGWHLGRKSRVDVQGNANSTESLVDLESSGHGLPALAGKGSIQSIATRNTSAGSSVTQEPGPTCRNYTG